MKYTKSSQRTLRVPVSLIGQVFLAISVAQARNDAPPSSDKAWLPPKLSDYENQLAGQRFHEPETAARVSINPRKTYNLAESIDIPERNNPDARVAWQRARHAAAADGLSETAYYPCLAACSA